MKAKWDKNFEVDHGTGCWLWQGSVDEAEYGLIWFEIPCEDGNRKKKRRYAHVVFWEAEKGPVPEGFELHHRCRVHRCVNPNHLEPLTREEHQSLHGKLKLTEEQVLAMRKDVLVRGLSYREVAVAYGITADHAKDVVTGVYWKRVGMPE